MPLSKYFSGHGEKVMANMQKEYGAEKGKRVFYATANKRKMSAREQLAHRLVAHRRRRKRSKRRTGGRHAPS